MGLSGLAIIISFVLIFLSDRQDISAPSGISRGWAEDEWSLFTDPPRFQPSAASRNISAEDIRLSFGKKEASNSSKTLTIEVDHGGKMPGDDEFYLSVHDIVESNSPSNVALSESNVRISYVGFSGWKTSGECFRKIYRMPGWNEVKAPEDSDDKKVQSLLRRLNFPVKKDWIIRCDMVVEAEGDILRFQNPRLIDPDHRISSGAIRSWGGIGKQKHTILQFDLFSRFPAEVALLMDVYHDCERGIPLPPSAGDTVSQNGYKIETLVRKPTAYYIPLTEADLGISTFRHAEVSSITTKQEFRGIPAEGGRESVFLNVSPFVRQDAIQVTEDMVKNGRTRWTRDINYPLGSPSTAPFGFFLIKNDPGCSPHVSIARQIDRAIIHLGRLPFEEWSGQTPEDLLDVNLPYVKIDGQYSLARAIGLPTGLEVEIDRKSLRTELENIPNQIFTDTSPREILNFSRSYLGSPSFDEENGIVVFEKRPSPVVERIKEWFRNFR